jgi:hypothetical protein
MTKRFCGKRAVIQAKYFRIKNQINRLGEKQKKYEI